MRAWDWQDWIAFAVMGFFVLLILFAIIGSAAAFASPQNPIQALCQPVSANSSGSTGCSKGDAECTGQETAGRCADKTSVVTPVEPVIIPPPPENTTSQNDYPPMEGK